MPGGYEWLIIIAVVLLLFGAKKLPEMARSLGQSARVFKGEMKGLKEDDARSQEKAAPEELPSPAPQQAASQSQARPQAQDRDAGTPS